MDTPQITQVKISELKPAEYNPREASEKEYHDLKASIEKFGIPAPLIVNSAPNRKNIIIGGHFRMRIAKDLGYKDVPVVYVNIPIIEDEKELNLRLNNNTGHKEIPTLEDVIFEETYEPNWCVIRFDDKKRQQILKALEELRNQEGIKIELAQD
ncbi:MAG: ParB N-terminal domain-containing protein [Candidatus Omnitrophica bacterium]|nr:ParB N-terminal domain-containing protein [Candidatus Omnitrophota bacterium]